MAVSHGSKDCFDAFKIEHDFLSQVAHVDPTQFQLADGRGGDPVDRATPIGLNEILAYWLKTPDADAFRLSLPILGVDGSGAMFCTHDCPAKGKVFSKPGSAVGFDQLNQQVAVGTQTLAGYLKTDGGCLHTFFIGVTGASTPTIDSFFNVVGDVNQISALLQEQASAREHGTGRE